MFCAHTNLIVVMNSTVLLLVAVVRNSE